MAVTSVPEPELPKPRAPRWLDVVALVVGLGLLGYVLSRFPLAPVWRACLHAGPLVLTTPLIALVWVVLNTLGMSVLVEHRVSNDVPARH